jgi:hypothetical protein
MTRSATRLPQLPGEDAATRAATADPSRARSTVDAFTAPVESTIGWVMSSGGVSRASAPVSGASMSIHAPPGSAPATWRRTLAVILPGRLCMSATTVPARSGSAGESDKRVSATFVTAAPVELAAARTIHAAMPRFSKNARTAYAK